LGGSFRYITSGGDRSDIEAAHDQIQGALTGFVIIIVAVAGTIIGSSSLTSVTVTILFVVSYLLVYYRLPLYPLDGLSMIRAYLASRRNPAHVFAYLHRSSLYWDELTPLPLPYLRQLLLLAAQQDIKNVLQEIQFVAAKRPGQRYAARMALIEIVICDLEDRTSLRAIASAWERIAEFLPVEEARQLDPQWDYPGASPWFAIFARLGDTSREAARVYSSLGWQTKLLQSWSCASIARCILRWSS
jgi:hypothetical protein